MQKGGFECPICHSKVVIAPVLPLRRERTIIVVRQAPDEVQDYRCSIRERAISLFCVLLLSTAILIVLIIRFK
jgi:hypothetical protein